MKDKIKKCAFLCCYKTHCTKTQVIGTGLGHQMASAEVRKHPGPSDLGRCLYDGCVTWTYMLLH